MDPTPWFYDAILKQSVNRPVEALQDIQKSIELNDNRAVYRSQLLLDQDLAARSASLGQIFNNLGFQQLGLVEGWKSVNIGPRELLRTSFPGGYLFGAAPSRGRSGQRASAVPASPAHQHQPRAARARRRQIEDYRGLRPFSSFVQRIQPLVQQEPRRSAGKRSCGRQ